ncbi:MAG: ypdA 5 [Bacteroidetes bacterium]|nr:ypdA 5 [Bacteroidota bacterium]
MKKAVLLILLLCFTACCSAQERYLRHYSRSDGLPSSETYWTIQDSKGYIWIASDMGAIRFDGYRFKVFTTADGLTDNTIFRFYEDYKGRIWFYTFSGRLCYYYNDTIYGHDIPVNDKLCDFQGGNVIIAIHVDQHDTILISADNGLLKVIPENVNGQVTWNKMEIVSHEKSYLLNEDYATIKQGTDDHTVVTRYKKSGEVIQSRLPAYAFAVEGYSIYHNGDAILFYLRDALLIDTSGRISVFKNMGPLISFFEENDNAIWVGQKRGGVQLFDKSDMSKAIKNILKPFSVTCIMKDRENGYWFTTLEDGVFYLPSSRFTYFEARDSSLFPVTVYNTIHAVGKDKILGLATSKLYNINGQVIPQPHFEMPSRVPGQPDTFCLNMYRRSNGEVWISAGSGIGVFDSTRRKLIRVIRIHHRAEFNSWQIIEDHQHFLWSLNHSSIIKIDPDSKEILKSILVPSRAETACEDPHGNILIGTISGLYSLTGDSLSYLGERNTIFKNRFVDIKRLKDKVICATRGAGLIVIDGDSIYQVTTADGLPSNMSRSIYIDEENVIWLSTNNGLSSIRLREGALKPVINSFSVSDGLLSDDNRQVLKNGKMIWLLSQKGIMAFDPDIISHNDVPPPVYITGVRVNNISYSPASIQALDYTTNFMEIDFVGLTYRNAGKQYYKYKLEGYDTTITYSQNTYVQFTKLPPGDYKFQVSCINNSGIESTAPAVFSFKINAPFYMKWWFNFSLSFVVIVLIILIAILYIRRIRRRESDKTEINRKIANLELHSLRAQMNPHFIFNCLNAIQDFILKNDSNSAKHYLSSFSKLIRKTLDHSRRSNIVLTDEIEFLKIYLDLERMRFSDKFSYNIYKEAGLEDQTIDIPSMILQPFIENSIRHGRIGSLPVQGELVIRFSMKENVLICEIEDNGIGLAQSQELKGKEQLSGQAHALDIINERIRTMNEVNRSNIWYRIEDRKETEPGAQGTKVYIHLPIIK